MRETFDLEYKQRFTKTCLKTASAYANYGSGRVIFGIDDDGNAVGLDENPEKVCLQIENAINDSLFARALALKVSIVRKLSFGNAGGLRRRIEALFMQWQSLPK